MNVCCTGPSLIKLRPRLWPKCFFGLFLDPDKKLGFWYNQSNRLGLKDGSRRSLQWQARARHLSSIIPSFAVTIVTRSYSASVRYFICDCSDINHGNNILVGPFLHRSKSDINPSFLFLQWRGCMYIVSMCLWMCLVVSCTLFPSGVRYLWVVTCGCLLSCGSLLTSCFFISSFLSLLFSFQSIYVKMSEDHEFALNYEHLTAGCKWRVVPGTSHKKGILNLCTHLLRIFFI